MWQIKTTQLAFWGHYNKFAQSNLGRGPRRGSVAHVGLRRKVPICYNGVPQIRYQKYSFPWTDPKPHLPHPWTRPTYDAKQHPDPIRRFPQCTGQTDRRTDRQIVHGKV